MKCSKCSQDVENLAISAKNDEIFCEKCEKIAVFFI